jgi:hypothetical protein
VLFLTHSPDYTLLERHQARLLPPHLSPILRKTVCLHKIQWHSQEAAHAFKLFAVPALSVNLTSLLEPLCLRTEIIQSWLGKSSLGSNAASPELTFSDVPPKRHLPGLS